jgi:hypothetical protein
MAPHSFCQLALGAGLILGIVAPAFAQTPTSLRPRTDVATLLAGRVVTSSFEDLREVLGKGQHVVVHDDTGRTLRGTLMLLTDDDITIASSADAGVWEAALPVFWPADLAVVLKRQFLSTPPRTFNTQAVKQIDLVDPTWNGSAWGAATGAGIASVVYLWERDQPDASLKGIWTALAVLCGIPTAIRIGHVLDRAINAPVYQRRETGAEISLLPLARPGAGIVVHVRF